MTGDRPKGIYLIGTEPGVGCSLIAAALAKILTATNIHLGVMVPIETGVNDKTQLGRRATVLKIASGSSLSPDKISPYRFSANADPIVAASLENQNIDIHGLIQAGNEIIESHDFSVFVGSGGLMAPVAGGWLQSDLISGLKLPLIIVEGTQRLTADKILMTLFAAANFELEVAGYLLNMMPQSPSDEEEKLPHSLAMLTGAELLGVLKKASGNRLEIISDLADQITILPTRSLLESCLKRTLR